MCMFYRLCGWLSSLTFSLFEVLQSQLQSHFKQTSSYFEVILIMLVIPFFKEKITPPENNPSTEISILFWHFSRIYRYFSRNVNFYSEQYSLLFRTMYSIIPNNTTYCSEQCKYTYDILRKAFGFSLEILDFSLEPIPQLLVIWQVVTQFQFPKKRKKN